MKNTNPTTLRDIVSLVRTIYGSEAHWLEVGIHDQTGTPNPEHATYVSSETFLADERFRKDGTKRFDGIYFGAFEHDMDQIDKVNDIVEICLKQEGILFLAITKQSLEDHHRPYSYLVNYLENVGYHQSLRFRGDRLECLATQKTSKKWNELIAQFQQDPVSSIGAVTVTGESLYVAPVINGDGPEAQSELYLVNPINTPFRIHLTVTSPSPSHPDIFLGEHKFHYMGVEKIKQRFIHYWGKLTLPPGGKLLRFCGAGEAVKFDTLDIQAAEFDLERFLKELPFDHYQRYQLITKIVKGLSSEPLTILDVGGALGYLPMFAPEHEVTVLDVASEDVPWAEIYDGKHIPYEEASFDVVVAVDTLEHIAKENRELVLNELSRVASKAVIVCGPFHEAHVIEAETVVQDFITLQLNRTDRFLDEHLKYTLPDRKSVRAFFKKNQYTLFEIPNGYLPRWVGMQLANNALSVAPELMQGKADLNALYNGQPEEFDNCTPAYRYALIATKKPLTETVITYFESLMSKDSAPSTSAIWDIASLIVALSTYRVIQEKDADLAAQGKRVQSLFAHIQNLELSRKDEQEERGKLLQHAENLQKQNGDLAALLSRQQEDAKNYQALNIELSKTHQDLLAQQSHVTEHAQRLEHHSQNLLEQLTQSQKQIEHAQQHHDEILKHADNLQAANVDVAKQCRDLQTMLQEKDKHSENLNAVLIESQKHSTNLVTLLQDRDTHIQNLEKMLIEKDRHVQNLEKILLEKDRHVQNMEEMLSHLASVKEHVVNLEYIQKEYESMKSDLQALVCQIQSHLQSDEPNVDSLVSVLLNGSHDSVSDISETLASLVKDNYRLKQSLHTIASSSLGKLFLKTGLVSR
jgi:ubiquinone/menaquinone biosynthesis C-methylase UbiE